MLKNAKKIEFFWKLKMDMCIVRQFEFSGEHYHAQRSSPSHSGVTMVDGLPRVASGWTKVNIAQKLSIRFRSNGEMSLPDSLRIESVKFLCHLVG